MDFRHARTRDPVLATMAAVVVAALMFGAPGPVAAQSPDAGLGLAPTRPTAASIVGLRAATIATLWVRPASRPASRPAVVRPKATAPSKPARYRGLNHVWIPSLGVSRSISVFPCSRTEPPGNRVYRWGCAGTNNVYLLGHAASVFEPLHDAYVAGRLKKGMRVWYADNAGKVHEYRVVWWRVTKPTTSASWAWAAQARPSMTLQTCLGASNELRLMVRLVEVA